MLFFDLGYCSWAAGEDGAVRILWLPGFSESTVLLDGDWPLQPYRD
jgi:hypothetical protein